MAARPYLHALAKKAGIHSEYTDIVGVVHHTSETSYVKLLKAMGYAAGTEQAASRTLLELEHAERARVRDPVVVVRDSALLGHTFRALIPDHWTHRFVAQFTITEENGKPNEWKQTIEGKGGVFNFHTPFDLPLGYHTLRLAVGGQVCAEQALIVVPERCRTVGEVLGAQRVFGLCANLYTLRSERNWGVGDTDDLVELARWSAAQGAAFLGLSPLHALRNVGHDISPYSPLSRLFRNVIYIDADAVPEMQFCIEARREMQSTPFQTALADCRGADRVQYESVLALKRDILRLLHGEFARGSGSAAEERRAAYEKFVTEQGDALDKFATFAALESHLAESGHAQDWRDWPRQYQDHQSAAVAGFRRNRAEDVEFQKYLQFELDRQMARAARAARGAGMSIGLYQDLAIGTSAGGADTWAYPQLFIHGARVGAPPDDYSHTGQDWGLPPIHPVALREDRYCYWRRLLQANMAHSGALRIDHVMGLLRQYWIPPGASAFEGAYVAYPADDLFGILALESLRHDAVIIGEDLGTVPAGFADVLSQRGILSCQVLYFEREGAGEFKPARAYSDRALVTSTTHDHPSLACFWRGDDLTLRRRVGSIDSDERLEAAKRQRDRDKRALLRVLKIDERLADRDLPYAALCAAVHRFLAGTPAPLLGLMLDDLTGELEPVNLPGVGPERHDSWRRRMRMLLEELMQSAVVSEGMQGASERRPPQHPVL